MMIITIIYVHTHTIMFRSSFVTNNISMKKKHGLFRISECIRSVLCSRTLIDENIQFWRYLTIQFQPVIDGSKLAVVRGGGIRPSSDTMTS